MTRATVTPVQPPAAAFVSRPELLAPAGDWDAMRAAVANGADAVYFGLRDFNARHRAANFELDELPAVMQFLHSHNVRGYVTVNTLIFSDELPAIADYIARIGQGGADAVIVQDLGLVRLIKRLCPTLPVHGSTQMTLTEPRGIEFVRRLGVERVIIARESSLDDIRRIREATSVPLETFVHGALCIAYSGQCLTSEALGGRSANRGQCAQACRLPYELILDEKRRDLGEKAYLLSPQDLAAADMIGELTDLGVVSFKIEGRLKSAQYVAAATQTYRAAVDAAAAHQPFKPTQQQQHDLQQSFSRGFSHGFFDGVDHQILVQGRFPKHRGVKAGRVVEVTHRGVVVAMEGGATLKPGDGVVFDEGHPEQDEQGGRIATCEVVKGRNANEKSFSRGSGLAPNSPPFQGGARGGSGAQPPHDSNHTVRPTLPQPLPGREGSTNKATTTARASHLELSFHAGSVNLQSVAPGAIVWRTDDPAIRKRLEQTYSRDQVVHRRRLHVHIRAVVGEALELGCRDDEGRRVTVRSEQRLEAAQKHPLTLDSAREQLSRLGDTPYELGEVVLDLGPAAVPVMVPKSVMNELRRQAVQLLVQQRSHAQQHAVTEPDALEHLRGEIDKQWPVDHRRSDPALTVLVRTLPQLDAALAWSRRAAATGSAPAMVYCEFEDIKRYKEAVAAARLAHTPIGLTTTRVTKPSEAGLLKQIAANEPDAVLVRNLAGLSYFRSEHPQLPLIADYSFNIANEITAAILTEQGVARMVPSFDLNWPQLVAMLRRFPPAMFEAVVHQHIPMFHMEHCVFCATLSTGKDYRDCGRPCDVHEVRLRDREGVDHPLVADVGCRNTVYNGTAQSAAEFVPRMLKLGIAAYRVEFLRETPAEVEAMLDRYQRVLTGEEDGNRLWKQLRVLNQLGVTRGTMAFE